MFNQQLVFNETDLNLLSQVHHLFSQLSRLLLGHLSYPVLCELLSNAMIAEGQRRIGDETNGRRTLSSIALLTGVRTHLIKSYEQCSLQRLATKRMPEVVVLYQWCSDTRYHRMDSEHPLRLLIYGSGTSFQRLVATSAGRGVTPQTVLARLVKTGNVRIHKEHWVELVDPVWRSGNDEELEALVTIIHSLNLALNTDVPADIPSDRQAE